MEKFVEVVGALLAKPDALLRKKATMLLTDRIKGSDVLGPDTISLYVTLWRVLISCTPAIFVDIACVAIRRLAPLVSHTHTHTHTPNDVTHSPFPRRYTGLAPKLVSLARAGTSEDTELAQSALFAITMLVVRFGANPDGWAKSPPPEITDLTATILESDASEPAVVSSAAVCFGAVCVARGPAVVEDLPRVMPALAARMQQAAARSLALSAANRGGDDDDEAEEEEEDEEEDDDDESRRLEWRQLLQCSAAAASTVLSVAPQFVGPHLKDLLIITAGEAFSDARCVACSTLHHLLHALPPCASLCQLRFSRHTALHRLFCHTFFCCFFALVKKNRD